MYICAHTQHNTHTLRPISSYPFIFEPNGTFDKFFNSPRVQEILHAPQQHWSVCMPGQGRRRRRLESHGVKEKMLDHDQPVSVVPYIAELLDDAQIRVLIYNGDRDMSCNAQGSEVLLGGMDWSGAQEWKTADRGVWLVDNEPAGYSRSTRNLEFLVVYNSGHLMPMNQPKRALDLVTRMVNGASFNDATLPVFEAPSESTKATLADPPPKGNLASNTSDCDTSTGTSQPMPRHRHTGILILFSLIVGFAGGVFFTSRYVEQSQPRRQGYAPVPEVQRQEVEVSSSQYLWRWWSSHHDGQRNSY